MDSFFEWVDSLPIPFFAFYILFYTGLCLAQHALLWLDGSLAMGEFAGIIFVQNVWFVFLAAAWHYLRYAADVAIRKFKPALDLTESEFKELRSRFVNLPAVSAWVITLLTLPIILLFTSALEQYVGNLFFSPGTTWLTYAVIFFVGPMNFGFFYMVVRSLIYINRIYDKVKRINLFNLTPLYALSGFTSRVGMIFVVFVMLNFASSSLFEEGFTFFYIIVNGLWAVLAFILPLVGIHNRLVAVKESAVEKNNDLIEEGFAKMQALVRKGKHKDVPSLRASNSALLEYRQELAKISTWPWDGATLRTFITALAVPMTVWIVQQVLLRTVVK